MSSSNTTREQHVFNLIQLQAWLEGVTGAQEGLKRGEAAATVKWAREQLTHSADAAPQEAKSGQSASNGNRPNEADVPASAAPSETLKAKPPNIGGKGRSN